MEPVAAQQSTFNPVGQRSGMLAASLFVLFLAVFLIFPSQHYMAVDGSVRSVSAIHQPELVLHGNNHMLYPLWIRLWAELTRALGIRARNDFDLVRIAEAMNSLCGAAVIAMLYWLLSALTERRFAVLCTLVFGFSTAFLLHATNAAEPVVGLFFAFLGTVVLVRGIEQNSRALWLVAGILFALALASYQGMGLIAGAGAFACVLGAAGSGHRAIVRSALTRLLWVSVGGVIGVCGVYGPAYAYQGIPVRGMPHQFFALGGKPEVYGGFTFSKFVNVPPGLIRNLYNGVPYDYAGIRSLLLEPHRVLWIAAVVAGLGLLAWIAFLSGAALYVLIHRCPAAVTAAALGACGLLLFPLLYGGPLYDKYWLLPLAALACILAFSFRPDALAPGRRNLLAALFLVVLGLEAAINIPQVINRHITQAPYLSDSEAFGKFLLPNDWTVIGFDEVSILWDTFWGYNTNYLLLPASTVDEATAWLNSAKQHCTAGNGRIFFIGVLDVNRKAWDDFLGSKVGIPYSLLDEYRNARILRTVPMGKDEITLREYGPCGSNTTQTNGTLQRVD